MTQLLYFPQHVKRNLGLRLAVIGGQIAAAGRANARLLLDTPALSEAAIVHFQHTSCGAPTRPLARDLRPASGRADQRALLPVRSQAVRDAPRRLLRPAQRHLGLPETPSALVPQGPAAPAQATKAIRLEGVVRLVNEQGTRRGDHKPNLLSTTAKGTFHNRHADVP